MGFVFPGRTSVIVFDIFKGTRFYLCSKDVWEFIFLFSHMR